LDQEKPICWKLGSLMFYLSPTAVIWECFTPLPIVTTAHHQH
jgi:hypothetical protein